MKALRFLAGTLVAVVTIAAHSADVAELAPLVQSTQLVVVTTADWNAVDGHLQRYERATSHDAWRSVGEPIPIVVGKTGLAWGRGVTPDHQVITESNPVKKEGDGKAPAGIFPLGTAFGFAPQPLSGSKMPYLSLTPSIECVDDAASKFYNRVTDRSAVTPDWNSSEHMRSVDLYRWGIVVGHNGGDNSKPATPGGGSCIFLHIWRGAGQGTVGCTAMPQADLESLLTWLDPARKPLLVQMPAYVYARQAKEWKLPAR